MLFTKLFTITTVTVGAPITPAPSIVVVVVVVVGILTD